MGYNLPINGVYWGYNPFIKHILTSWDIQVAPNRSLFFKGYFYGAPPSTWRMGPLDVTGLLHRGLLLSDSEV